MKRYLAIGAGAAAGGLVWAQSAFAGQSGSDYPPTPTNTPSVLPTLIHHGGGNGGTVGGTAFTGADLVLGFLVLGALLVVGLSALFFARRRAARTEPSV